MGYSCLDIEVNSVEQEEEITKSFSPSGFDSVKDYLAAAGTAPLLTAEQEIELAKRIEVGDQ